MASDTPASGCGPEAQREQWKQVREHIHREHEQLHERSSHAPAGKSASAGPELLLTMNTDAQHKLHAVDATSTNPSSCMFACSRYEVPGSFPAGVVELYMLEQQITSDLYCRTVCMQSWLEHSVAHPEHT